MLHHGNTTSSSGTLRRLCFSNVKYSFVSFEGTVRCQPLLLSDVSHSRSQPTVNPSIPDAKSSRRCFICPDHTIQKLDCYCDLHLFLSFTFVIVPQLFPIRICCAAILLPLYVHYVHDAKLNFAA